MALCISYAVVLSAQMAAAASQCGVLSVKVKL